MPRKTTKPTKKPSEKSPSDNEVEFEKIRPTPIQDVPTVYANFFEMDCMAFDFEFRFGEIIKDTPKRKVFVKDKVVVRMSPENAKAVLKILGRQIQIYEASWKEIPDLLDLPPFPDAT